MIEAVYQPTALGVIGALAVVVVAALAAHARAVERSSGGAAALAAATAAGLLSLLSGGLLTLLVALEVCLTAADRTLGASSVTVTATRWLRRGVLAAGGALLVQQSGSTLLSEISRRVVDQQAGLVNLAFALLLGGLFSTFGSLPTPLTSRRLREARPAAAVFVAVGPRIVTIVAAVRILELTLGERWIAIARLAAIGMIFAGTIGVVAWIDLRRRIASAAVAQAGAVLLALGGFDDQAGTPLLFGLLGHGLTFAGAFAAIAGLDRRETRSLRPVTLLGAGRDAPLAAGALSLCLLSVGALPFTPGFLSTFMAVLSALDGRDRIASYALVFSFVVLAGSALAAIGRLYSLPLALPMAGGGEAPRRRAGVGVVSLVVSGAIVVLGSVPAPLFRWIDTLLERFG